MSILENFSDLFVPAIIVSVTMEPNDDGEIVETETNGATIWGVKYNRSEASRYFSSEWAADITDVFVTDSDYGINKGTELKIDGVNWSCDEPVNVADMGEVYTIGLRRKA
jgi:hypothetical protein